MNILDQHIGKNFALYNGDCIEVLRDIPDNSIHGMGFSPPFASLYTYSASERDLGNARNEEEFLENFLFAAEQFFRVLMPGRILWCHCMDIPAMKERDGFIGLHDFPGDLIRLFQSVGFIYHSRVLIWKDPLVEATRTKALGLMHKQIVKDSSMCRQGLPDYVIAVRKPGENPEHVAHPEGFTEFLGDTGPDVEDATEYSHQVWRRYASPVWMDIRQSNTLNRTAARAEGDERHICPLQLDVIARCWELWTNPGDTVCSPFAGIGSEIYQALLMGRRGIGIELKPSYYQQAVKNCEQAETESNINAEPKLK